jgi:hypothetical protein
MVFPGVYDAFSKQGMAHDLAKFYMPAELKIIKIKVPRDSV